MIQHKDKKIQQYQKQIGMNKSSYNIDHRKITDIQARLSITIQYQTKLQKQFNDFNIKLEKIQKLLIKHASTKLNKLHFKINQYINMGNLRIQKLYQILTKSTFTQTSSIKPIQNQSLELPKNLLIEMNNIKEQIRSFKGRQFQYDNFHINKLQDQFQVLKVQISKIQNQYSKLLSFRSPPAIISTPSISVIKNNNNNMNTSINYRLDNSSFSRISNESSYFFSNNNTTMFDIPPNHHTLHRKHRNDATELFDDYHIEQPSQMGSIQTDGQFFHPMSSSFQANDHLPINNINSMGKKQSGTLNLHNSSFENFTSQQQDQQEYTPTNSTKHKQKMNNQSSLSLMYSQSSQQQQKNQQNETENQLRIKRMFMTFQMKLPVKVEIFTDGRIRIHGHQFLADQNDQYIRVCPEQIHRLYTLGFIIY